MTEAVALFDGDLEADYFDRRASPRLDEYLPYSITINPATSGAAMTGAPHKIVGHTRDMSAGGLAIIVPSITFAYRHLLSPDFKLRLTLELPSGPVEIEGMPTHDRPLRDSDADMHYMLSGELDAVGSALFYGYGDGPGERACILGLKITAMSDEGRSLYDEHLRLLGAANSPKASGPRAGTAAKPAGIRPAPERAAVNFWGRSGAASFPSHAARPAR